MTATTPPSGGGDTLAPKPHLPTADEKPVVTIAETVGYRRASPEDTSIRPFAFRATDEQLHDLKRRIAATRWPERETGR